MICPKCGVRSPWHGLCDDCLDNLRPMPEPSVSSMDTNMRYLKHAIVGALCALILLLAVTCSSAEAKPRPPVPAGTPVVCIQIWEQAPVGQKWIRLKKCLDRYCAKPRAVPGSVTVKGERVDRNQRKVLGWITNTGRKRALKPVFVVSAIATTTQEASAREIRHGHGTSVGPFQLIDIHGTVAQRVTIEFSGTWFYNGAKKVYRRGMGPVELSHSVQRSAHPTAVARWVPEARRSLKLIMGPCYYTLNR